MNKLQIHALHDRHRAAYLTHDNERLRAALALIADIASGSTTPNSLPNIARLARNALVGAQRANPSLLETKS